MDGNTHNKIRALMNAQYNHVKVLMYGAAHDPKYKADALAALDIFNAMADRLLQPCNNGGEQWDNRRKK